MNMNDAFLGSLIFNKNGGSSGSDGHTIVDNEGVSLEQRTNLQFNGAYSEDNSTDDTTEVNVVREMTKAEFDELTEEEKTGFINITDITGGNDDRFQPVIYSEEEREIGVWTDGKPLYEKTYHNSAITIASDTELTIDDFSDKFPVSCNGVMHNSTDDRTYYPNYSYAGAEQANIYYKKDGNGNLVLRSESDSWGSTWEVFTVVRYTKTTDQAGSGQWTPQGVPTHHYSENEQVVGTWIDGSTLYEKTVIVPITADTSFDVILAWLQENDTVFIKEGFLLSGGARRVLNFYVTSNFYGYTNVDWYNNAMHLGGTINGYSGNAYVTLRYTKSST